jgi:manganese efflux pump family protein
MDAEMSILSMLLIAVGLAMDAFAVSIASGVNIRKLHLRHALWIAGLFGLFQAVMPLLGWLAGHWARDAIEPYDHWIAFGLLAGIGIKMILESRALEEDESEQAKKAGESFRLYVLLGLALATSIDALAVGVTLSVLDVSIVEPILVIGLVTFVMSFAGAYIGEMAGHLFEWRIELFGGVVLICMGAKILLEHLL